MKESPPPITPVTGYRQLNEADLAVMNEIKAMGEKVNELLNWVANRNPQANGISLEVDLRWVAIARTDLQQGFMALTRSIAQPTTF